MPPKNKKESEEELKRQEQQRKRKEQQEARLEQERLKYAPETLPTGLLLPASAQLIIDFPTKSLDFVSQKLKDAIQGQYPALIASPRISFVVKELHYYIKDASQIFGSPASPEAALPHRIMVAAMFATLVNQDSEGTGQNKDRENDQRCLKDIVVRHCQKTEDRAYLSKLEGLKILKYASERYFSRFLLMKMFDKFKKKPVQKNFELYLETPTTYTNDKSTIFVDLSQKPKEQAQPKKD